MNFARNVANTTIFMHQGKIWEEGPSKELFANPQTPELQGFVKAGAH
jgi:polar amino acid transport system ATP-binding protein